MNRKDGKMKGKNGMKGKMKGKERWKERKGKEGQGGEGRVREEGKDQELLSPPHSHAWLGIEEVAGFPSSAAFSYVKNPPNQ